jgi:hypothetical protein
MEATRLYYDDQKTNTTTKIKKHIGKQVMQQLNLEILTAELSTTDNIVDIFNSYFFSIADNSNINNNNAHTQNKYSQNIDNDNSCLQSLSQIHKSTYTNIERKTTKAFEIEKIIKLLKSKD